MTGATQAKVLRVLQGAAQRGGAILLHFCGSPDPFFSMQQNEPFLLHPHEGYPLKHHLKSGAKKEPQSQRIARTVPKNFLNNSSTRKFARKFGEIFVAKVLWGTFSVPDERHGLEKAGFFLP